MVKTTEYIINKPFYNHKKGDVVTLRVDENGTPLKEMWRRRLRDAKIDNCISLKEDAVEKAPKSAPKSQPKTEKGN